MQCKIEFVQVSGVRHYDVHLTPESEQEKVLFTLLQDRYGPQPTAAVSILATDIFFRLQKL